MHQKGSPEGAASEMKSPREGGEEEGWLRSATCGRWRKAPGMEGSGSASTEEGMEVGKVVTGRSEKDAGLAHPLAACFGSVPLWIIAALSGHPLETPSSPEPRSFSA